MFFRMIYGALFIMIAFTIALGTSLATAMLGVMMDVGDKVNQELKAYGANITVVPKENSVIEDLYDVEGGSLSRSYLKEDELGKIKTIFWAFNIVDYAPFLTVDAKTDDGSEVKVVGSWFNHHMELPTGEELDAGLGSLRSWWSVTDGRWIDEQTEETDAYAMLGISFAEKQGLHAGDTLKLIGENGESEVKVRGIYDAGGDDTYNTSFDVGLYIEDSAGADIINITDSAESLLYFFDVVNPKYKSDNPTLYTDLFICDKIEFSNQSTALVNQFSMAGLEAFQGNIGYTWIDDYYGGAQKIETVNYNETSLNLDYTDSSSDLYQIAENIQTWLNGGYYVNLYGTQVNI